MKVLPVIDVKKSVPCGRCCEDFNIEPLHMLDPGLLPPLGREYIDTIGVAALTLDHRVQLLLSGTKLPNGNVLVKYRCMHLNDQQRCDIYAHRPKVCADFSCEAREDRLCTPT